MLIKKIMQGDIVNCKEALEKDFELWEMRIRFYEHLNETDDKDLALKALFDDYVAKSARIAYLQGIKDFAEFHVMLKLDMEDLLALVKE